MSHVRSDVERISRMEPLHWIAPATRELLDVGCNVGELLSAVAAAHPRVRLAGCDVNAAALGQVRTELPAAEVREAGAALLPFADERFDVVTCIEVLEHVPPVQWGRALREMWRVLGPGGRRVLAPP